MKRFLRNTLSDLRYQTMRFTNAAHTGLRILTYHRVTDAHPDDRLCVPVRQFEAQMRHLDEDGYCTVSFSDAARWVRQGGPLPQRSIVISFDDGFDDNYQFAATAMARHHFKGIFFIPTQFIEGGVDGHGPDDRPMSWAQIEDLLRQGHEIGSHSVTHRKLTQIPVAELPEEVGGCKRTLEQRLARPIEYFCYPAGYYNETVKQAVTDAGYRGACTVEPGANRLGTDPFALKRTEVSAFDSLWDFEKKLAGAYDWLHAALQGAQRRRRAQHPTSHEGH